MAMPACAIKDDRTEEGMLFATVASAQEYRALRRQTAQMRFRERSKTAGRHRTTQDDIVMLATSSESYKNCSSRCCRETKADSLFLALQSAYGYPKRILHGHNHFVSDVVVSSDGQFALSSSWDKTLRLWDLNTGLTTRRFVGHTSDVLSVSFSADNRQIVSGSRDRTIKLWNTLGECKFNIQEDGHTEWVSCVRFSPNPLNPVIVSAGWDKVVKVSAPCHCLPALRLCASASPILYARPRRGKP